MLSVENMQNETITINKASIWSMWRKHFDTKDIMRAVFPANLFVAATADIYQHVWLGMRKAEYIYKPAFTGQHLHPQGNIYNTYLRDLLLAI